MAHLTLAFLGTFSVTLDEQPITRFRSANVQGLLVYLALNAERAISRDVLATLFWPDEPDRTARTNFRQTLYQLRKLLPSDDEEQRPFLHVTRQTVQLNPDAAITLDVQHFVDGVEQGDLATAVSHYRGELLPGFTCDSLEFEDWLRRERERLHGLALDALSQLADRQLAQRDYPAAKATVQRQLALEPWREAAHRQMMLAHALDGDRQAALAQFDTCRDVLWQELAAKPDADTATLAKRIAAGDDLRSELTVRPQHNLPALLTPFFGREAELALVQARLQDADTRLVSLVGAGGLGKSRLALEAAWQLHDRYRDGVWFVPLAGLGGAGQNGPIQLEEAIAMAIAQAMGQTLQGTQAAKVQLLTLLRERQALLVLDNFEHLLPGANLIIDLLQHAPQLAAICTSREPLNYLAEWVYPLPYLPLPQAPPEDPFLGTTAVPDDHTASPAVQLFVDRAQRANGRFTLNDENRQDVARLCRLLTGLPLALELAAAAMRHQSLPRLIDAVQRSIDVLATRRRDVPLRHRSMRAIFTTSWQTLNPAEKILFADLSIFRGDFAAADAAHVAGVDAWQLEALVDKSLLQSDSNGRFRLHALLRHFAAEQLAAAGRTQQIATRHSAHFLQMVARLGGALTGPEPHLAADRIAAGWDNVRQAWQTAVDQDQFDPLLTALVPLSNYCQMRGLYREGLRLFDRAADAARANAAASGAALARLLAQQAAMLVRLANYPQAEALVAEALPLTDDVWTQSRLHITLGEALWRQGNFADAKVHLATAQASTDAAQRGLIQFHLGLVHLMQGDNAAAAHHLEASLAIWQQQQNRRWQGFTLISLGSVATRREQYEQAAALLAEAHAINKTIYDGQGQILALTNLGLLATQQRQFDRARRQFDQALRLAQKTGDLNNQALLFYNLAWSAKEAKDWPDAAYFADKALAIRREVGDRRGEGMALGLLGDVARANGRFAVARTHYEAALALSEEVGNQQLITLLREALQALEEPVE